MNKTLNRIVFFGNERIATGVTTTTPVLQQLIADGYDIVAIVVNHERIERKHKVRQLEIAAIAEAHNIPLLKPDSLSDIAEQIHEYHADVAVLVAYGKIVPQSIIDMFPAGIINVHPSLLPKHRGSTPIESVLLAGEPETGVSLMQLVRDMDAGPVYAQSSLELAGTETKQELADELTDHAAAMLHELLPDILAGTVVAMPQDHAQATYDGRIHKQDGILDWTKSGEQLEREIRAYAVWPKSTTTLGDVDVVITSAHCVPVSNDEPGTLNIELEPGLLQVACADGYLCIDSLKPAGKNEMTVAEFVRGYGQRLH